VLAVDQADTEQLRKDTLPLRTRGAEVHLGLTRVPDEWFDLAVVSPGVPCQGSLMQEIYRRGVPVIGEIELAYQYASCPIIAITGTNGKTTTTELVARLLRLTGQRTVAAGNIGQPLSGAVAKDQDLDYLTVEVSSFQLETIRRFRPAVAVVLNLTPDHMDRYAGMDDYIRAKARILLNQEASDWAIIQQEALAQMQTLRITIPSQVITFSARDGKADLALENGAITSRSPLQRGPLLSMSQVYVRGPHNAENLMAALAVGMVSRLPMREVGAALRSYRPAAHRCELVAEIDGVRFVNDSKATNVDAVRQALSSLPSVEGRPNIWLIAGGKDKGFDYAELGPALAQRVRHAFLLGETRGRIRFAWERFTACTEVDSLLEAVTEAAQRAVSGDVVLLSPACSSFDMFQNYQHRGEVFRQAVQHWAHRQGVCGKAGVAAAGKLDL
jgi:UDP-N-acetylmuramoylalanine--D-glutamate ligase